MAVSLAVVRREFAAYFATPLAYVFLVAFVAGTGALTFYAGSFFGRRQADLVAFFQFHPWLLLALAPAIGMRLWAEERRTGTLELLLTLPITTTQAVLGKFLAAWLFAGLALLLTTPLWVTVSYLGAPDHGVILAAYAGSFLLAGAMLAVSSCVSALTRNQVVAFILGASVCLLLLVSGVEGLMGTLRSVAPEPLVDWLASASMLTRFVTLTKGVLDWRDVFYFVSLISLFLFLNICLVERGRTAG